MANRRPLRTEEKLKITEALRKGNLSHREISRQFKRSQSTVNQIAKDAVITPTLRRKRSPRAHDVEGTYSREQRIELVDRAR
jgi:transposase